MGNVCSISISINELVSPCWDFMVNQQRYACEVGQFVDTLTNDWEDLKGMRNDIRRRIGIEERQGLMERLDEVRIWLSRVDGMEAAVDQLLSDASSHRETTNKCLGLKSSYKLGKKLDRKLREVDGLKSRGKFDVVTYRLPSGPAEEIPCEPTTGMELMFNEARSYMIEDEQAGIIGLYGMGGAGKTTLLTKLNNELSKPDTRGRFDVVIWIVVSKTINYNKVQDDIGRKMEFPVDEWRNKSEEDKARAIFRVLGQKKFVLFLDDIWARFDLAKVGVPPQPQSNRSKVVFTTRSKAVCGHMKAHKTVEVKCLTEEEALYLFRENVGGDTLNAHQDIPELAEVVAKECDGLPLALITIGRAMAYKTTPQEWRHAIQVLKSSAPKLLGEVLPLLKFSYDSLQSVSVRSCFLYCSLYPEDYNISKRRLIDQWICEGFLDEDDNFHAARNSTHDIIGTLVRSSLLEVVSDEKVKMHDVIRDMALWIGGECGSVKDKFFVQAGVELTEVPMNVKWEEVERMSLMNNKIVELTGTPKCPNLLTLFLNDNNNLEKISGAFFQSMPTLRVLDLSMNYCIRRLPKEICELVSLHYLNLSETTGLEELPIELKNLVNLKYLNLNLNLSLNRPEKIIPEGIVANLIKLQVLHMLGCCVSETLVKELESLKYLNCLSITIETASMLSHFLCSPKLSIITTNLELKGFNESKYIDVSFLQNMTSLNRLTIFDCEELEELIIELEGKEVILKSISHFDCCFLSLTTVQISDCPNLKDLTWLTFAPSLRHIGIISCDGMEAIIGEWKWGDAGHGGGGGGTTQCCLFSKLEILFLYQLRNLESIYSNALPFPCLKDVNIVFCPKLKKLPFDRNTAKGFVIKGSNEEWWNRLEWEDEATKECFSSSFHVWNF